MKERFLPAGAKKSVLFRIVSFLFFCRFFFSIRSLLCTMLQVCCRESRQIRLMHIRTRIGFLKGYAVRQANMLISVQPGLSSAAKYQLQRGIP